MSSVEWRPFCLGLNVLIDGVCLRAVLHVSTHVLRQPMHAPVNWYPPGTVCEIPLKEQPHKNIGAKTRLLHNPSLMVVRLSVRYETWPAAGWGLSRVIIWPKYR